VGAAGTHAALMAFRLGELCSADDDALRYRLTLQAVNVWTMCACVLISWASLVLAGNGDKVVWLVGSEGALFVLSVGVRCGWMASADLVRLKSLSGCSVADLLDEQAKCILQLQRGAGWAFLARRCQMC